MLMSTIHSFGHGNGYERPAVLHLLPGAQDSSSRDADIDAVLAFQGAIPDTNKGFLFVPPQSLCDCPGLLRSCPLGSSWPSRFGRAT